MSRVFLIGAILVVVAAALVLFWERHPAPREELKLWRQKLDEVVQRTESETYAPDATAAARDSLGAIEHLVEAESGRLPFFRDYTPARDRLNRFGDTLAWLESQAVQGKEAMRKSVEDASNAPKRRRRRSRANSRPRRGESRRARRCVSCTPVSAKLASRSAGPRPPSPRGVSPRRNRKCSRRARDWKRYCRRSAPRASACAP